MSYIKKKEEKGIDVRATEALESIGNSIKTDAEVANNRLAYDLVRELRDLKKLSDEEYKAVLVELLGECGIKL